MTDGSFWAWGGMGVVLGLVVQWVVRGGFACRCRLGRGSVLVPEAPPPSVWAWGSFFLLLFILVLAIGLLSQKKRLDLCAQNNRPIPGSIVIGIGSADVIT